MASGPVRDMIPVARSFLRVPIHAMIHRTIPVGTVVCLLSLAVGATTLPKRTTRDLLERSDRVCCVECNSCEARLDRASGIVFTHVRFTVLEEMKGAGERSFEIRIPGGEAGGVRTVVVGMPRFTRGQESVLFLKRTMTSGTSVDRPAKTRWVVSLAHRGHVPIRKDKSGKRRLTGFVTGFRDLAPLHTGLEEFRTAVRGELKRLSAAKIKTRSK